jgi:signal transduction histidine kinase
VEAYWKVRRAQEFPVGAARERFAVTLHTPTPLAGSLEAMEDGDQRLSLLFDNRAAIVVDSADGAVVYANPAAAVLFGADRPDQLSDDPENLRGPGIDRLRELGRALRDTGHTPTPSIEMLRFFVGPRTLSQGFTCSRLALSPRRDQDSAPKTEDHVGVLAVAVRKVRQSADINERADALFGQSPDPVIVQDREGTILYRNAAAERLDDPAAMHAVEREAGAYRISFLHQPALDRIATDEAEEPAIIADHQSTRDDGQRDAAEERGGLGFLKALAGAIGLGGGAAIANASDDTMAAPATSGGAAAETDAASGPQIGTRFRFSLNQNAEVSEAVPGLSEIGLSGKIGSAMDDLVAGDPTQLARAIEARDTFNRISIQWHAADHGAPVNILLSGLPILDGEGGFHGLRAFGVVGARAVVPAAPEPEDISTGTALDNVNGPLETTEDQHGPVSAADAADIADAPDEDSDSDDRGAEPDQSGGMSERLEKLVTAGAGLAAGGAAIGLATRRDAADEPARDEKNDESPQQGDAAEGDLVNEAASEQPPHDHRPVLISADDIPARRPMRPTEETLRPANGLARSDQQALDEIAERLGADPAEPGMDARDEYSEPASEPDSTHHDHVSILSDEIGEEDREEDTAEAAVDEDDDSDGVLVPFTRQRGGSDTRFAPTDSTEELDDPAEPSPATRDWARIASAATALGGLGAGLGLMGRDTDEASEDTIGDVPAAPDHAGATNEIIDLVDRLPLGMLFVRDEAPLYANRAFLDLFGYADIGDLEAEGGMPALFENLSDTQVPGKQMLTGITRDNRPFQVEARLQMARWVDGPAVLLSIRERDRFDTQPLENADAEIAELRDVLDVVPDAILVADKSGRIRALNAAARDLLGPLDRAGQPPLLPALFADEAQGEIAKIVDQMISDSAPDRHEPVRAALISRHGERVDVDTVLSLIGIGLREKICAILRRPAKSTAADAETAASGAALAENGKSDVLAKVSHEIRTPINAIIGFADMMLDEQYGPIGHERYTGYLRDIKSSGMHIVSLVNDLLDLSKVEAGMLDLEFAETRLNDVVEQCAAIMQSQASRDNVILRTSLAHNLPPVVADIRSIRQILLNLLSNAIKFTNAGGHVIVSTIYADDGAVELRVRDTGTGMSEEDIAKALEPYRQSTTTGPDHPNRGSGIGLPLTRALAEANRARFAIDSTPGDGTTVRVSFPPTRVLAE